MKALKVLGFSNETYETYTNHRMVSGHIRRLRLLDQRFDLTLAWRPG